MRSALLMHFASHLLTTEKRKRIAVHIFESGGNGAPGTHFWWMVKADSTLAPFFELGTDVFGQEDNPGRTADELEFLRFGSRSYQQKHSGTIRRSNCERMILRCQWRAVGGAESQLIQVELPAAIRITNENGKGSQAKVGILTVLVETAAVSRKGRRMRRTHSPEYIVETASCRGQERDLEHSP
jgi:hypothetical protein